MKQLEKYNFYLYTALRIFLGIDILFRTKGNILNSLGFLFLFTFLIVNDHFRWKTFYKNKKHFYISFSISMIIGFFITLNLEGYMDIYLFVILYELILFTASKISKIFVALQIGLILSLLITRISKYENILSFQYWRYNLLGIMMYTMGVLFYSLLLYMYKTLGKEKRNVDALNKELEELTITKERNRVAGEIHDSLGHGLIALSMNLDVAEKIIDTNKDRAKELIRKSRELVKMNVEDLRKAVYALKEEGPTGFKSSIEEIINNIESSGSVTVSLAIPESTEELPPEYKQIIYSTIKEALTNSIKHGNANEISIVLEIKEVIKLVIMDNGIGCENLVKGSGLLGIENRVREYKGSIKLENAMDGRFTVELELPKVILLEYYN